VFFETQCIYKNTYAHVSSIQTEQNRLELEFEARIKFPEEAS